MSKFNSGKSPSNFIEDLRKELGIDFVTIKVKFGDKVFEKNIVEDLVNFDPSDVYSMQKAFAEQATKSAKYGIVFSEAKKKLAEIELDEKKWRRGIRAKISSKIYRLWKERKIRKSPTKDDIDADIDSTYPDDSDLYAKKIFKWRNIVDQLDVLYKASRDRKDMLVSCGYILNRMLDQDAAVFRNKLEK